MKAPIASSKHYVQHTQFTVASATVTNLTEIQSTSVSGVTAPADVIEGSVVKAIYVELWLLSNTNIPASFVLTVEKGVINTVGPSFAQMAALNSYPNKKNVLYTTQGLLGDSSANPTPVTRMWIKIPKGKQRFGFLDKLIVSIASIGTNEILGCGFSVYKSYI